MSNFLLPFYQTKPTLIKKYFSLLKIILDSSLTLYLDMFISILLFKARIKLKQLKFLNRNK